MKRIVILGATGSGKTTFGKRLAGRLGYAATDLDDLNWLPGWTQRPAAEMYVLAESAAQRDAWVIIGNYSKVRQAVWPRADTFIWLDYPFPRVFWQLLNRTLRRIMGRQTVCNGNVEGWRQLFSKNSIVLWLFRSYWRRRREYGAIFEAAGKSPRLRYIRFTSPKAADDWLQGLKD